MYSISFVQAGDDITHSYTEPLDNVITRRSILKLGKFFQVKFLYKIFQVQ